MLGSFADSRRSVRTHFHVPRDSLAVYYYHYYVRTGPILPREIHLGDTRPHPHLLRPLRISSLTLFRPNCSGLFALFPPIDFQIKTVTPKRCPLLCCVCLCLLFQPKHLCCIGKLQSNIVHIVKFKVKIIYRVTN